MSSKRIKIERIYEPPEAKSWSEMTEEEKEEQYRVNERGLAACKEELAAAGNPPTWRAIIKTLEGVTPVPPPVPKKGTIDPKLGTLDLKTSTPKPYGDPDYGKEYDPEGKDLPF